MDLITAKMESTGLLPPPVPPPSPYTNGNYHLEKPNGNHMSPHSLSPGSISGRSSCSSLNNVPTSNGHKSSLISNGVVSAIKKDASVQFRKVSINDTQQQQKCVTLDEEVVLRTGDAKNGTTSPQSTLSIASSSQQQQGHRTSLIHISAEKRAKKVRFFINSDKFYKGVVIAVSAEKFRTFEKLLEHLTRIMCNQVTLPHGVRCIFALDGKPIETVDELQHGANYICSSTAVFKKLDYLKMAQEQDQNHWNTIKRETCYLSMGLSTQASRFGTLKRDAYRLSGHSKSFGLAKSNENGLDASPRFQIKPKIIAVLRSGIRPRRAVRVLLNNRNTKSFDTILADLTNTVKLDTGAVRKVFTLNGKPVVVVADFAEDEVFIAYGVDKCSNEDFDLDMVEFRNVQSILKSPELDAKYEKYSSASPKTSRRKFLLSRQPVLGLKRKSRKSSSSKTRESPANGSSSSTIHELEIVPKTPLPLIENESTSSSSSSMPLAITAKYEVGNVIGDGNFAVVHKCVSKRSRQAYALKVIDKSKCAGKEHMIESEIAILNLVSHSNIIELIEVFDYPEEKYLVTEYVKGGDLFDAIAADTKYSELVSRRMVSDLASALKYLHDKMIVHRDIKPENLLVVDLGMYEDNEKNVCERLKSLKLGDFGLAQLVSEPLFTVCGTPTYVAPEILAETGYGVKVDVWATGVIMYILLVGYPPFSSRTNNQEELFDQILSGIFEFNSPDWDEISYPAKELISWMLQVDPLQRYSAYEIMQHPWIKGSAQ